MVWPCPTEFLRDVRYREPTSSTRFAQHGDRWSCNQELAKSFKRLVLSLFLNPLGFRWCSVSSQQTPGMDESAEFVARPFEGVAG